MGRLLPDDWPPIDDEVWYCVGVECYPTGVPTDPCGLVNPTYYSSCILGQDLNDWVNSDLQCSSTGLFNIPFFQKQRIVKIVGPYDAFSLCGGIGCMGPGPWD